MRIHVVTLSYNQANWLQRAIDSVVLEGGSRHELCYVVVDPGSTDGSREIIQSNASHIQHAILSPDLGPADGLNKGLHLAGDEDVFAYINADDCFLPQALTHMADLFESDLDSFDVLLGGCLIMDVNGQRRRRGRMSTPITPFRVLSGAALAVQQATFVRVGWLRRVGGFNQHNKTCWDWELVVDLMLAGARFKVVPKAFGCFRVMPGTISSQMHKGDHAGPRWGDMLRIENKVAEAGYRRPAPPVQFLARALHRIDPLRHLRELTW